MEVIAEEVEVVEVASLANKNNFYQFMYNFLCLPTPPRSNTFIKFRLVDTSKPSLINSLLPLKLSVWANLLTKYPESL